MTLGPLLARGTLAFEPSEYSRQEIDASDASELFGFLQTAPVCIVEHDDALERAVLELALVLRQTVYNCVYLRTGTADETDAGDSGQALSARDPGEWDHNGGAGAR